VATKGQIRCLRDLARLAWEPAPNKRSHAPGEGGMKDLEATFGIHGSFMILSMKSSITVAMLTAE
jgi:hypothetical protein